MRDPLHAVPVRYKLPLMFISVCLLAFGVGGYLVSGSARSALEGEILARLEFQSRAYATALAGRLQSLARRTEDFASDGYIRDHTEALLGEPGGARTGVVREELRGHLIRNKLPLEAAFVDLWILDSSGRVLVGTKEAPEGDFPQAIPPDGPAGPLVFSNFLQVGADARARLFISTPLFSRTGARPLGRLVAWVHPGVWIVTSLGGGEFAGSSGMDPVRLHLVDGKGDHLQVDPTLASGQARGLIPEILESDFGTTLLTEHASRVALAATRGGQDLFTKSYPVGESGWSVRVDLISENALAPVGGLQNRFLGVGLILAIAASLLFFFPMRFLARPLQHLTDAARRLRDGDFGTRVPVESSDEIGQLAQSFNSMASAVQERTESLQSTAEDLRDRQRELAFERDRMQAVISSMRDGLVVLDEEGTPVVYNRAAEPILEEILESEQQLHPHHDCLRRDRGSAECRGCLFDTSSAPRSCMLEIAGGVFEIHATRFVSSASGRPGRVLVSRDLSDRIAQDERQIHQERLAVLGEVAAVMAHELNNPLAAISMYNQMTAAELEGNEEVLANTEVIQRNVAVCKRTIRELLDYATDTTPEITAVHLADTLEDVSAFLRPLRERSNVALEIDVPDDLPEVSGDEVQIRQVFTNLVVNAIQAIGSRGGTVRIRAEREGTHAVVEVEDDGPGIPEEVRDKIFRPFFTTKSRGEGTGLGLPTARRIAEMHGGSLRCIRTGAQGTCFQVRLSLA